MPHFSEITSTAQSRYRGVCDFGKPLGDGYFIQGAFLRFAWVGSCEMTAGNLVCSHGAEPRGAAQAPSELTQCARPGFVHWRPCLGGGLYTGVLGVVDFVHCEPRSKGTLYTGTGRHCTNPLRNDPSSAQSPDDSSRPRAPSAVPRTGCSPLMKRVFGRPIAYAKTEIP